MVGVGAWCSWACCRTAPQRRVGGLGGRRARHAGLRRSVAGTPSPPAQQWLTPVPARLLTHPPAWRAQVGVPIARVCHHAGTGLLAAACEDHVIRMYDMEVRLAWPGEGCGWWLAAWLLPAWGGGCHFHPLARGAVPACLPARALPCWHVLHAAAPPPPSRAARDDRNWHQSEPPNHSFLAAPDDANLLHTLRLAHPAPHHLALLHPPARAHLLACRARLPGCHPMPPHPTPPNTRHPHTCSLLPASAPSRSPQAARLVRQFRGHTAAVSDMQVSHDCRWLLSASLDGTVRCWDIPGGGGGLPRGEARGPCCASALRCLPAAPAAPRFPLQTLRAMMVVSFV